MHRINVGGPTHHAAFLTKFLDNDIFETLLISGNLSNGETSGEYILNNYGVKVTYLKSMFRSINLKKDFMAYNEIRHIIKTFKPDIVHTHAAKSGTLGRLAAIQEKVPVIIHTFHGHVFHSYFGFIKTFIYKLIEKYLARNSSKIIAISELQKKELVQDFKITKDYKITIINLGFDLTKFTQKMIFKRKSFRDEFHVNENEIAIGIVGRLTHIKNQKFFIEALSIVNKNINKKIKAFIIGDGEDRKFLESVAKNCNIEFTDNYSTTHNKLLCFTSWRKDMDYVYAGLDIVCLTSLNEGTPVTLIEAQAASKPIVSTNVGGVKDVVLENISGLISEKDDFNKFSSNLIELIENDNLRRKMSLQGKNYVLKKFNYNKLVSDIKKLYLKSLKQSIVCEK